MFRLWGWQPLIDNESEWQQWWMGGGAMDHGVGGGCWQCHWRLHHCDCLTQTPVTRSQWKPAQKAVVLSLPVVMRDIAFTRVTLGKWSGQIIFISIDCSFKKETVFSFSGHDENIEIQLAMDNGHGAILPFSRFLNLCLKNLILSSKHTKRQCVVFQLCLHRRRSRQPMLSLSLSPPQQCCNISVTIYLRPQWGVGHGNIWLAAHKVVLTLKWFFATSLLVW